MDGERLVASKKVLFNELCEIFREIQNTVRTKKRIVFDQFLRRWKKEVVTEHSDGTLEYHTEDTFYPAIRLFVPSKDKANRDFQIKEARLNHLVCKALNTTKLDKKDEDSKERLVEKLVSKAHRLFPVSNSKLSIADVNEYLDRIKAPNDIKTQEPAMEKLCRQCTENELRWIFHIILGDIERALGGVNSHTILEWLRPGADNMWKEGSNLLQICERVATEDTANVGISAQPEGNLLCKPFRPMLLKRLNYDKYCLPKSSLILEIPLSLKIIKFCHRPFYLETKYDGEHLLLHRFEYTRYNYYTRNGIDYTYKMGATNEMLISKRIHNYFKSNVRDCVLDCELLIWDRQKQEFVGKNKRASDGNVYDPKNLDEDFFENHTNFDRSLAIFDILYLNGHCFVKEGIPLKDRMKFLDKIMAQEDRSVIFISQKHLIQKAEDFCNFYKKAMQEGEEGIVVKSLNSLYRTGSRAERNGWFKIKPDYGLQSALDLAIVGLRFENENMEKIKSFIVACRLSGSSSDIRLKTVAGITSRLKLVDFQRLMKAIGEYDELEKQIPDWLELEEDKVGKYDRYLTRERIQVVEVRASGLLNGRLQFPSIVSIRTDKPLDEIDSMNEIIHFDERLRSRPMIDENDPHEANVMLNRKRRNQFHLKRGNEIVRPTNINEIGQYSNALKGQKVCVLNANQGINTQDLQKILISLGATPIANSKSDMAFAVAMNPKQFGCLSQIKANRVNIIHGNWLLRCEERKQLLPWEPEDIIHKCENAPFQLFSLDSTEEEGTSNAVERDEEEEDMMETEDQVDSNDHLHESTSARAKEENAQGPNQREDDERSVRSSSSTFNMVKLAEEAELEENKIRDELLEKMSGADCEPAERGNLFADFIFFLHQSVDGTKERNSICRKIEAENGQISNRLDSNVTHVVIDKMRSGQEKELFDWNERKDWLGEFVSVNWIDKAIEEEDRYRLQDRIYEFIDY